MIERLLFASKANPAQLETLYRSSQDTPEERSFRQAMQQLWREDPKDPLLGAWAYRLDLSDAPAVEPATTTNVPQWSTLIGAAVLLGLATAFLARGESPVPIPGETSTAFLFGWAPLVTFSLLAYLTWTERGAGAVRNLGIAAVALALLTVFASQAIGPTESDATLLVTLHLPFVCWTILGAAVCARGTDPGRQAYGFVVKSVETLVMGGLYLAAGLLFLGLTFGIFSVLGIELPEEDLIVLGGWASGALPMLALGSVYHAALAPADQDFRTGLTRTLRTVAYALLPLALGVLAVYVLWFIPVYFWKAFEDREVLIVYNATILAILVLVAMLLSGPIEDYLPRQQRLLRYGVTALVALTIVLNLYAFAAILTRTLTDALTANRFAVIGWNVTTLVILAGLGARFWRSDRITWWPQVRSLFGALVVIAAIWGLLLILIAPAFAA